MTRVPMATVNFHVNLCTCNSVKANSNTLLCNGHHGIEVKENHYMIFAYTHFLMTEYSINHNTKKLQTFQQKNKIDVKFISMVEYDNVFGS